MSDKPIIIERKNGHPTINGHVCSYQTKKIRKLIHSLSEVNESFVLPKQYTFEITQVNRFAKIIKRKNN